MYMYMYVVIAGKFCQKNNGEMLSIMYSGLVCVCVCILFKPFSNYMYVY